MHSMVTLEGVRGGRGAVGGVLVPSLYMYPCLSDQRRIGSEEGLNHGSRLSRPVAEVILQPCLYLSDECLYVPLITVPTLACKFGWGLSPLISVNRWSNPTGVFGGFSRKHFQFPRWRE